jgi:uncharacterized cupin superfamily protein
MTEQPAHVIPVGLFGEGVEAEALPETIAQGSGLSRIWNAYSGEDGRFHVGHWQSEPGVRHVVYTETELCVILEGRVRLTDTAGNSVEFGPGEAFVIAPGFRGTWESIGRVTKVYAVLEPGG